VTLYGEAISAIRSIILIDERLQSLATKLDKLADDVRGLAERLIRLETIVQIARADSTVLRITRQTERPE
jgi:hypothetical protein